MTVLPAMVDLEVVKDDTLAELLGNVAVHTKETVLPLLGVCCIATQTRLWTYIAKFSSWKSNWRKDSRQLQKGLP